MTKKLTTAGTTAPPCGRPFQPGQSGNPGGRPKTAGLRGKILELCGPDGDKMVDLWVLLAFGTDRQITSHFKTRTRVSLADRLTAARELVDRAFGKPVQIQDIQGDLTIPGMEQAVRSLDQFLDRLTARDES